MDSIPAQKKYVEVKLSQHFVRPINCRGDEAVEGWQEVKWVSCVISMK